MNILKFLALVIIFCSPRLLVAAEQDQHRYTPKELIEFSEITRKTFDHSGKTQTHSVLKDGTVAVENNGSGGNVSVARLGPDGKIETYCTTDIVLARNWMAGEDANQAVVSIDSPVVEK